MTPNDCSCEQLKALILLIITVRHRTVNDLDRVGVSGSSPLQIITKSPCAARAFFFCLVYEQGMMKVLGTMGGTEIKRNTSFATVLLLILLQISKILFTPITENLQHWHQHNQNKICIFHFPHNFLQPYTLPMVLR